MSRTARPEPAMPADNWRTVVLPELQRRLSRQMDALRARTANDAALRGLAIGETEVNALLTPQVGTAADYELGSLWDAAKADPDQGVVARLAHLQDRFRLSAFEIECLIACLAPEAERKFERIYAYLNDNVGQRYPSAELLLNLFLPISLRCQLQSLLAADARLLRYGLLTTAGESAGAAATYRVADGVVRFLFEQGGVDSLLARVWCAQTYPALAQSLWERLPQQQELAQRLRRHLSQETMTQRAPIVVQIEGRPGSGRRYVAESACRALGYGCIALDARLLKRNTDLERTLIAAFRDSVLSGAPLLLHHLDTWFEEPERLEELRMLVERLSDELGWVLFLSAQDAAAMARWCSSAAVHQIALSEPGMGERAQIWAQLLAACTTLNETEAGVVADTVAAKFRLTRGESAEAMFRALGSEHIPSDADGWSNLLLRQAASVAAPRLKTLAKKIDARHVFDDLVLAEDKKELLYDIVRRVRYKRVVMDTWGFENLSSRGRGLVALFYGPSGTGKTMGAEVIANALGLDLYRVDLAGVVSKYIGETEKNLRALFDEADRADALLFFDEADALFGKRSEVRDAHDRYANIEINYLLQRLENFSGIAILATNMRQHLDEAFLRRIHISLEFSMPRMAERLGIWERSFPRTAPLATAADLSFLAERFEIAGGSIRNIALGAAYLAAESQGSIDMEHLVAAAQREFVKSGKRVQASDFGAYAALSISSIKPGAEHGLSTV